MSSATPLDARAAEIAKIVVTKEDVAALQQHLKDVMEGAAFKGSHRSGQFLKYIVDGALAGHFESLKERVIGVELFGRSPSYDTGEDAIVRVTASDVRKRLLQHYGRYGATSEFRISLPLGSYIPEFTRSAHVGASSVQPSPDQKATPPQQESHQDSHVLTLPVPASSALDAASKPRSFRFRWLAIGITLIALNLVAGVTIFRNRSALSGAQPIPVLPWSFLFNSTRATQLITSDPNIAEIQMLTGTEISISDYANHNYLSEPNKLTPEVAGFCRNILRGDKTAAVDVPIAVNIAELAQTRGKKISVHAARSIQLSDLKTDDNFIFLGSPRSNPWSDLFSNQLDFRIVFDPASGQEIIRNVNRRPNELAEYVPTALGWATGQSFAIIAVVQNPDQSGHVLLVAGANGEGTGAAGKLITDSPRLSAALQKCGISPSGPQQHFEMLLQLNTMAGSPSNVDVVACHILPELPSH
jgi:hypothetical protein